MLKGFNIPAVISKGVVDWGVGRLVHRGGGGGGDGCGEGGGLPGEGVRALCWHCTHVCLSVVLPVILCHAIKHLDLNSHNSPVLLGELIVHQT